VSTGERQDALTTLTGAGRPSRDWSPSVVPTPRFLLLQTRHAWPLPPCPLPPPPRSTQLIARNAPGYAIGGLAGGETKDMFWRVVAQCAAGLPPGKPRYVMGIGYPLDVVVCSALGAGACVRVCSSRRITTRAPLTNTRTPPPSTQICMTLFTRHARRASGWRSWTLVRARLAPLSWAHPP
jgi:hypothetical protein